MITQNRESLSESLDGRSVVEFNGEWWFGRPKPQQENNIIRMMETGGVAYYRPITIVRVETHHRIGKPAVKWTVKGSLFGGYIFFCGEVSDRIWARDIQKFASITDIRDQLKFVKQLTHIEKATKINPRLAMGKMPKKGMKMIVTAGPYEGTEGWIDRPGKGGKFFLVLDAMSQAAELEIDASLLEPI